MSTEETTYRGIRWQRDDDGHLRFFDAEGERWVTWSPGVDAPPLPPAWASSTRAGGMERPSWHSRWRLIPVVLVVAALAVAIIQGLRPSASQSHKEAKATAALLDKCLPQTGFSGGRPQYSATPVPCDSPSAAVRVVSVIPSSPGSPLCPANTVGVELPYPGVRHPHVLCIETIHRSG